jgi:hypothetical protein
MTRRNEMYADLRNLQLRHITALGYVTQIASPEGQGDDTTPEIMFMVAPYGVPEARHDIAKMAKQRDIDVVVLEFEAGKEHMGGKNIVVFERSERGILRWTQCDLWSQGEDTLCLIVPRDQRFGLISDGIQLRRVNDIPAVDLTSGILAARRHVQKVAMLLPEHALVGGQLH